MGKSSGLVLDLEFLSQFQNQYQKNGIFSTTEANERMKTIDPRAIDLGVLQMDGLLGQIGQIGPIGQRATAQKAGDPTPPSTARTTFRPKLAPASPKRRVHVYIDADADTDTDTESDRDHDEMDGGEAPADVSS